MKINDLTKGNVIKVLIYLAVPIMLSSFLQFTYNIIDMLFVGYLGSNAVASIGACSFYIGLGYSINAIAVIGCGIKTSHALGENHTIKVKQYINSGIILNLILAIIYSAIVIIFGKNIIAFLNMKNAQVESEAYIYLCISAIVLIFNFFNSLYIRILNSYGNNSLSLKISAAGVAINIVFDYLLIYVMKTGVKGAAIATLIANIIMFILFLVSSKGLLSFDFKIRIKLNMIKEIIRLGIPNSAQRILFTFINIYLARIIAQYGSEAIAAQKIGLQIESVTYMVIGGLFGAVSSFTGQNYGAGNYKRINKGYNVALVIGMIYSGVMTIIFLIFNDNIVSMFIKEMPTLAIAGEYLRVIAYSQIFSTIEMVSNGYFSGIGKPIIPSVISIIFTAMRIPMAFIFMKYYGLTGVWISIALSSILKGATAYMIYLIEKYKVRIKRMSEYVR